jgi:hypothetical protein
LQKLSSSWKTTFLYFELQVKNFKKYKSWEPRAWQLFWAALWLAVAPLQPGFGDPGFVLLKLWYLYSLLIRTIHSWIVHVWKILYQIIYFQAIHSHVICFQIIHSHINYFALSLGFRLVWDRNSVSVLVLELMIFFWNRNSFFSNVFLLLRTMWIFKNLKLNDTRMLYKMCKKIVKS